VPFAPIERHAFYARARKAYCVIATGEARGYGCFVFTKGVLLAPDAPRANGGDQ
jgi:L-fucose mutarotase